VTVCPVGCNFATIAGAINAALANDIILVQAGTYAEPATSTSIPLTIKYQFAPPPPSSASHSPAWPSLFTLCFLPYFLFIIHPCRTTGGDVHVNGPGPAQAWLSVSSNQWAMNGSFVLNAARIVRPSCKDG